MSGGFWRNNGHVLGVHPTAFALPSGRSGLFCVLASNSGSQIYQFLAAFTKPKKILTVGRNLALHPRRAL
jgi:hypothetical protein